MRNSRDLGEYVHRDFTYQAFLHAAFILLGKQIPFKEGDPYTRLVTQGGFVTFGVSHLFDLVARVANLALMTAWCHKWLVHRRVRPEAFAGRVHQQATKTGEYPIHTEILNSAAPPAVQRVTGSYLLPMAYPEGCPLHPAYPAGHATVAGACVTALKAFFKESSVLPDPMAANIALGRDAAGVHWRSDSREGLTLGEAVAIGILTDLRTMYHEEFHGFSLTKFDGSTITI